MCLFVCVIGVLCAVGARFYVIAAKHFITTAGAYSPASLPPLHLPDAPACPLEVAGRTPRRRPPLPPLSPDQRRCATRQSASTPPLHALAAPAVRRQASYRRRRGRAFLSSRRTGVRRTGRWVPERRAIGSRLPPAVYRSPLPKPARPVGRGPTPSGEVLLRGLHGRVVRLD